MPQYGRGDQKQVLSSADLGRLFEGLRKFNEDNLDEHQSKLMCLVGYETGARGADLVALETSNVDMEVCPPGHPCEGMTIYRFTGLTYKLHRLSRTNVYVDDED